MLAAFVWASVWSFPGSAFSLCPCAVEPARHSPIGCLRSSLFGAFHTSGSYLTHSSANELEACLFVLKLGLTALLAPEVTFGVTEFALWLSHRMMEG